jgi:TolA-binding protein
LTEACCPHHPKSDLSLCAPKIKASVEKRQCGQRRHLREQRSKINDNRTEIRELRTENREQRTENREQRTESREQRTESRERAPSLNPRLLRPRIFSSL